MMNSQLTILSDFRSGERLELVVPTKNEEHSRLLTLKNYYSSIADLVILDNDGDAELKKFCLGAGITLLKRGVQSDGPEFFFIDYCTNFAKSSRVMWFFADEFISLNDLGRVDFDLNEYDAVAVCRVDYLYGDRWSYSQGGEDLRAFRIGAVEYSSTRLHAPFRLAEGSTRSPSVPLVFHLHPVSIETYLGTPGRYASREFAIQASESAGWGFWFQRFVRPILGALYRYVRYEKKYSVMDFAYIFSLRVIYLMTGIMIMSQRKYKIKKWEDLFLELSKD